MTRKLFTIGYDGATQDGFITSLKWAGVETIIDVRNRAYADDKGFSPRELSAALKRNKIDYVALSAVALPPAHSCDDSLCRTMFEERAEGCCALCDESVNRVAELAAVKSCCLLCFEFDPVAHCHRGHLASRITDKTSQQIEHLFVAQATPFVKITAHLPIEIRGF